METLVGYNDKLEWTGVHIHTLKAEEEEEEKSHYESFRPTYFITLYLPFFYIFVTRKLHSSSYSETLGIYFPCSLIHFRTK